MQKKLKARLFQIPAILLLIIVPVIGTFYIKITNKINISWFTPIAVLAIAALYFYGRYLENKSDFSF